MQHVQLDPPLDLESARPAAQAARRVALAAQQVLVLSRDPAVIAAASAVVQRRRGKAPTITSSGPEALARLAAPGAGPHQFVADPSAAGASWPHLIATLADPSARTALVVVSSHPAGLPQHPSAVQAEAGLLAEAMNSERPRPARPPAAGAAELAEGLKRGEITVRYQPVVRMADRKPMMVEALARWQRQSSPIPPDAFVPLAERSGLARALSVVIASRAAAELGRLHARLDIGISLNLPLAMLLQADLVQWLHKAMRHTGLRPGQLTLELTETTEVRDISTLRRALVRLRAAGFRVLLDDIVLDDPRRRFFHLPFLGFKLDRGLVTTLPEDARARSQVQALVRLANRHGQTIIAEGVSDLRLWGTVKGLGVHHAQGFIVGRPLPAEALPAWWASWRSRQPG